MEKSKEFTIDSEFERLLPDLSQEELDELEKDLVENGCRDKLIVWQGILLDGHTRYKICLRHGIGFETKSIDLPDRTAAILWAIRNQFARRNLSTVDRIRLALRYKEHFAAFVKSNQRQSLGRGKKGQAEKPDLFPNDTRTEIAKLANSSGRMVSKVEYIDKNAPLDVKQQLDSNTIKISKAYELTRDSQKRKNFVMKDSRLVELRERINANREEITLLKTKLTNMSLKANAIRGDIKELANENRKLQQRIAEIKGSPV